MRYFLPIIFLATSLSADTYLYIADTSRQSPETLKAAVAPIGIKGSGQPYENTSILNPRNTDYLIISVTPNDRQDFKLEQKTLGVYLYKIIRLNEDGFFENVVDFSKDFNIGLDWSVKRSS